MEINTISFNVSKTINIGNFEAIKINYGQSITVDPTRPIEEENMWYKKPIAIQLDNKHWLIPMMDDEGNDGGAIQTTISEIDVIPVI